MEWQGSTKTEFTSSVDAGLVEGYNLYYSELDSALDAVNDAITRYENEKYEQNGIIGQIQIVINNWKIGWIHSDINRRDEDVGTYRNRIIRN